MRDTSQEQTNLVRNCNGEPIADPSSPSTKEAIEHCEPLEKDVAYARRAEIVDHIIENLAKVGIDIRGRGAAEFETILAMTANAFMPEYFCTLLHGKDLPATVVELNAGMPPRLRYPPDVTKQQQVCKYFREHAELKNELIECFALSAYLGHPLYWMGTPAINIERDGRILVGDNKFGNVLESQGHIFIPGCGVTTLKMLRDFLEKNQKSTTRFFLCDNHPFVAEVASRFCRYLADARVNFSNLSLEAVQPPTDTSRVFLSYVEAAGEEPLRKMLDWIRKNTKACVICVAGSAPNEYSGVSAETLSRLLTSSGFSLGLRENLPSYATHVVSNARSVDFLDLSEAQAHYLIMTTLPGGPQPNSSTWVGFAY